MEDIKQFELDTFEKKLMQQLFGSETLPQPIVFGLKMAKINIQDYIDIFEFWIKPMMDDKGMVDGTILNKLFEKINIDLKQYITIPQDKFRLVDIINSNITWELIFKTILNNIIG